MQKTHNHASSNFIPSHNSPVDMSIQHKKKTWGWIIKFLKSTPINMTNKNGGKRCDEEWEKSLSWCVSRFPLFSLLARSLTLKSHWKIHKNGSGKMKKVRSKERERLRWEGIAVHFIRVKVFVWKSSLHLSCYARTLSFWNHRQAIIIILHSGIITWIFLLSFFFLLSSTSIARGSTVEQSVKKEVSTRIGAKDEREKINKQSKILKILARWQRGISSRKALVGPLPECFM